MKKSKTSASWREFIKELQVKCKEKDISLLDLVEWISISIKQIEKKTFDYYITCGPTPKFSDVKIDVNIVLDNFVHGFTIYENKKEYNIFQISSILQLKEEISGEFISAEFRYGYLMGFAIEDRITNSAKLRNFVRKISNKVWEME